MTITIFWIRHGYSCANIHKYIHAKIRDPHLTYDGLECSEKSKQFVPTQVDYILCSSLKRAMETALAMYPPKIIDKTKDKKIISVPYIGEKGFGLDNTCSTYKTLIKYFESFGTKTFLDLKYHDPKSKHYKKMSDEPNIANFFNLLSTVILKKKNNNENINIAIVTHSHFMAHNNICEINKKKKVKPNNNSIFKIIYNEPFKKMADIHARPINKKKIIKIYDGCDFNKKNPIKLSCHKKQKTCKKNPIETGKKYYRCSTKKFSILNNIKFRTLFNTP